MDVSLSITLIVMATDKNRVTAYIDDATFEALQVYCETHSLSQSAAVASLLEAALKVEPGMPPSDTLKEQILEEVIKEFDLYTDKQLDNLEQKLKKQLEAFKSEFLTDKSNTSPSITLNNTSSVIPKNSASVTLSDTPRLTNAELARLLGVSPATVSRWSTGKRQPPKNLNWEFNPVTKKWNPKTQITTNL